MNDARTKVYVPFFSLVDGQCDLYLEVTFVATSLERAFLPSLWDGWFCSITLYSGLHVIYQVDLCLFASEGSLQVWNMDREVALAKISKRC